jgi:hypothetical protein
MKESWPYTNIFILKSLPKKLTLIDHLGGFDENNHNLVLSTLDELAQKINVVLLVHSQYIFLDDVIKKYKNLSLVFNVNLQNEINFKIRTVAPESVSVYEHQCSKLSKKGNLCCKRSLRNV